MANITRTNPFEDFFFKVFPAESDLDIPGVKKEDIQVDIDDDRVSAEYKDGVLSLTLPKKGNGSGKRIAVS